MSLAADLVFTGGPVFTATPAPDAATGHGRMPTALAGRDRMPGALAVLGDRIVAVGQAEEVAALAGRSTRVVDLAGRLLVPGFIDAHAHLLAHGATRGEIDCKYPGARSIRDIQNLIRERARVTPPGRWVRAWGYDQRTHPRVGRPEPRGTRREHRRRRP
ncbi:MAG: hypothetical protein C4551_02800 [Bacillota bacterium]|nr:MAG: hypothetical protein C4551_02800 [Bacillota bacterium]